LMVSTYQCVQSKIRRTRETTPTIRPRIMTMPKASDSAFCLWLQGMMVFSKW
jgi:hypothetical protein